MSFAFSPHIAAPRHLGEEPTFTIDRLWRQENGSKMDLSHLVDRTYAYRSVRELRWHLAERFAVPVSDLQVDRA